MDGRVFNKNENLIINAESDNIKEAQ